MYTLIGFSNINHPFGETPMTMETSCPAGPLVHHAALEGGPSLEAQAAVQHGVAYHGRVIGDH